MVVISWTPLSDSPRPITGYNITIDDSTETVDPSQNTYNVTVDDSDCGSSLQISVSAMSAAGTGSITTMSIPVNCICECCTVLSIMTNC